MQLTLEIHFDGHWREAATLELRDEALGYRGAAVVDYHLEYFVEAAAQDFGKGQVVRDCRAFSVGCPVDLENRFSRHWPPFLLDLMPQGHARRMLAAHLGLEEGARQSDIPLLLRAASGGIGNVRIKSAADAEAERLHGVVRRGVTEQEIFDRSDLFLEVVDRFGMLASGSSGLQGEWPKVSMTQAEDGLYYPDSFVADDEAVRHVIIKLLRSREPADQHILSGEALYSQIAREIGLNVHEPSRHANGVLIIARFDRQRLRDGRLVRLGQESLVSAIGVADFGHTGDHETYIDMLRQVSADPFADIAEYLKRDIANLALGNPDNHGRNSALSKYPDGQIRLSPLFDFAPMRLAVEGIMRSTKWRVMGDRNSDHRPDWPQICASLFADSDDGDRLLQQLRRFAASLERAPEMARQMGAHPDIMDRAMARCSEIARSVLA
jgi:serine/threonine-protein kinase HipA